MDKIETSVRYIVVYRDPSLTLYEQFSNYNNGSYVTVSGIEILDENDNIITTTAGMFSASSSYSTNVPGNLATGSSGKWQNNNSIKSNIGISDIPTSSWLKIDLNTPM